MAFRTNLVPAIEERTVSGSSVSFNSAFALPLKACKVSFSATQASGTPSPSNPLPISGVSAIGLTANSTPVSVSLGDTRYGGELDVLTGIMTVDTVGVYLKDYIYRYMENYGYFTFAYGGSNFLEGYKQVTSYYKDTGLICECFKSGTSNSAPQSNNEITITINSNKPTIRCDAANGSTTTLKSIMGNSLLTYPLAEPITVQLSANELSSIIGNNTFSTDTGSLEITFADLQEKSASGSVATFNTALAMPLSSCNIAVNAWQEGSGDPSPSNVRPIHGFSVLNATRAGKNWCPYANLTGTRRVEKAISLPVGSYVFSALCTSTDTDSTVCAFMFQYTDGTYSSLRQLQRNVRSSNTINIAKPTRSLYVYASNNDTTSVNDDFTFSDIQIELGSTATAYEPYVTPTIYTIQLGQEVYGAEVDAVNGVMSKTYKKIILDGTQDIALLNWRATATSVAWCYVPTVTPDFDFSGIRPIYCPILKSVSYGAIYSGAIDYQCAFYNHDTPYGLFIRYGDISLSTKEAINEFLSNNPIEIIYPVIEPIESNIGATPISTNIGNNTIFADTGDVDLTYKDLDIAKRGSFREVFELPS